MNNAEEKLRELVKKAIEIAEDASHMSDTIDMLLSILEPGDLMEMRYEEYLQEYRKANDRNITDELKADIEAAMQLRHETGEKAKGISDDRPPETLAEYMRRSDPAKLQRDVLHTTGEIMDVLAPILKAVLSPVLSSEN